MAVGICQVNFDKIMSDLTTLQENHKTFKKDLEVVKQMSRDIKVMKEITIDLARLDATVEECIANNPNAAAENALSFTCDPNVQQFGFATASEQHNHFRSSQLKVFRFFGDNSSAWISQIQRYFDFYNIPDHRRLAIASYYLDGNALDWYEWMNKNQLNSCWKEFLAALERRFGHSDSSFSADNLDKGNEEIVSKKPTTFLFDCLDEKWGFEDEYLKETNSKADDIVIWGSEDINEFMTRPDMLTFMIEDMYIGSNDAMSYNLQSLNCGVSSRAEYLGWNRKDVEWFVTAYYNFEEGSNVVNVFGHCDSHSILDDSAHYVQNNGVAIDSGKNNSISKKSSVMLKVTVHDAAKEMINNARSAATLLGHKRNHLTANIEVRRTEIKPMVEHSINFPRISLVDDEGSWIVWVNWFKKGVPFLKQGWHSIGLFHRYCGCKALHDGFMRFIENILVPVVEFKGPAIVPIFSLSAAPIALQPMLTHLASPNCQQIHNNMHISLKYWFCGTGCRWKKFLGMRLHFWSTCSDSHLEDKVFSERVGNDTIPALMHISEQLRRGVFYAIG